MENVVKIKSLKHVTHDVINVVTEKPADVHFTPGQATEVFINKNGWLNEGRPFTFTCLPDDEYLEFVIKVYSDHDGVTNELSKLKVNDELLLKDIFGEIKYKGAGIFIAGGAGVTPFISIFRDLQKRNEVGNNKLIFANKTKADIILKDEFEKLLKKNFINILSEEKTQEYSSGYITENILKENIEGSGKYFYVCGPPPMMDAVEKHLAALHVEPQFIVKEAF